MGQYLLIPFLVGWTSIYQLFWCSPGVQGFDPSPFIIIHPFWFHLCPLVSFGSRKFWWVWAEAVGDQSEPMAGASALRPGTWRGGKTGGTMLRWLNWGSVLLGLTLFWVIGYYWYIYIIIYIYILILLVVLGWILDVEDPENWLWWGQKRQQIFWIVRSPAECPGGSERSDSQLCDSWPFSIAAVGCLCAVDQNQRLCPGSLTAIRDQGHTPEVSHPSGPELVCQVLWFSSRNGCRGKETKILYIKLFSHVLAVEGVCETSDGLCTSWFNDIQWYSMYISHWSSALLKCIQSGLAGAKESRCKEIADELVRQVTAIGCDENNAHIGRRGFNMLKNHSEWLLYG